MSELIDWEHTPPHDWPHTPRLEDFVRWLDHNNIWTVDTGHLINLLEDAISILEETNYL